MQLDVAGDVSLLQHRLVEPRDVAADEPDPLADRLSGSRDFLEIRRGDLSGRALASDRPAFLVRPDDDVERVTEAHALIAERARHLDGAKGTDGPVEVAAVGHRVDVRADEDRLERAVGPLEAPEDVPRRVDARREPRLSEEVEREGAPREVGLGVGDAVDARRRAPDGVELREPAVETRGVHTERGVRGTRCNRAGGNGAQERKRGEGGGTVEERATLHGLVGIAVAVDAIGNFTRTCEVGKGLHPAPHVSPPATISKQHLGRSPRSQHSRTGVARNSASSASIARHTCGLP